MNTEDSSAIVGVAALAGPEAAAVAATALELESLIESLFGGTDNRIGVTAQACVNAASAAAGLPLKFVRPLKKRRNVHWVAEALGDDGPARIALGLDLFVDFAATHLGSGDDFDIRRGLWVRKWAGAWAREAIAAAALSQKAARAALLALKDDLDSALAGRPR